MKRRAFFLILNRGFSVKSKCPKWKYIAIKFKPRRNPHEEREVCLSVNGNTYICKRNLPVILPREFVVLANHCNGKFPLKVLGKATHSEFIEMFKL